MASHLVSIAIEPFDQSRLRAFWTDPVSATRFCAEFSDNLAGSIGLCRFLAMLRVVAGYPVQIVMETEAPFVQSDAVRAVLAGDHPPIRFDGRYGDELQGGVEHEAASA